MLSTRYDPADAEHRLYALWEAAGCFRPSGDTAAAAYSIVIPPPNVTGVLHMGHALNNTLQDVLIRFERMRGKNVLWQPGTDHAGIATQMVVERQLAAEGNEDRKSLGREAFLERVWDWKAQSGGRIIGQLKRLGASCDWSRERFTMGEREDPDNQMVAAVRKVFVDLYRTVRDEETGALRPRRSANEKGLIYRDKRLVNWDPHFQTAISDLEVEQREVKGHFWHLRYPLADGVTYEHPVAFDEDSKPTGWETRDYLVVATTRPETMLGDTGIAVNPEDERYAGLVGKFIDLPIVGRRIPIVADVHADPEQGSGAVKITPAHDFNDFEVGKRAGLVMDMNILTGRAEIVDEMEARRAGIPEALRGLDRFEARKRIVALFEDEGLLQEVEDKVIQQPFGDRSGVVIEPWLTDQWYVDAQTLAEPAIAAVRQGKTRFVPENWEKTYFNWLEDIQPWCISRQLWWGHRIPVWYGPDPEAPHDISKKIPFVAESEAETLDLARKYYGADVPVSVEDWGGESGQFGRDARGGFGLSGGRLSSANLTQDPDVLDTWFSSALWPFSTQGWPDETSDLATFYPTATLVTAFDIIFFWVARMMMMGLHFMDEVPFRDVYIHALVLDEKGQKMSKSKGNAMDPLELIDEYGADALRFTMARMAGMGRNIRLSTQAIEGNRNFATKLWNAARFCQMNECVNWEGTIDPAALTQPTNRWIVSALAEASDTITAGIETYRFNEAAGAVYRFVWNVFCDWYLELLKPLLNGQDETAKAETRRVAGWVLDEILKLLHPFMPFVTEELWGQLAEDGPDRDGFLMLTAWPAHGEGFRDAEAGAEIDWVIRLVSEVRSVRSDLGVPPGAKVPAALTGTSAQTRARLKRHGEVIERLARLDGLETLNAAPAGSVASVIDEAMLCLRVAGLIDPAEEAKRLDKEMAKLEKDIAATEKKLANRSFVDKAPPEIVEENRERLGEATARLGKLQTARRSLEALR